MAGLTFTVELDDAAAATRLAEMVERMERPIEFYKNVGEYLKNVAIPRNFDNQTAPDGSPWAALSPVTIARREKKGQVPIRILRASSGMYNNLSARQDDNGVRVGTPVPQGAVMQFGAAKGAFGQNAAGRSIPWGDIPARPFLGLSIEDEVEIIRIAEEWLGLE